MGQVDSRSIHIHYGKLSDKIRNKKVESIISDNIGVFLDLAEFT